VIAALVVGAVFVARQQAGCLSQSAAPDQRFAQHMEDLCEIARDHIETPEKGVKKMGRYLAKNLGSITGSLGSTIAVIERVADDEAHDERARLARDRIHAPLIACEDGFAAFGRAVERDPKAKAIADRAMIRLSRTVDILVGKRQSFTLRDLPVQLERAILP
jgi:hypothetical protein